MSDLRVQSPVTIEEVLTERTYRASLPNGKSIFAFALSLDPVPELQVGDAYSVLLSLCNFDEGRLVDPDLKGFKVSHPVIQGANPEK